MRAFSRGSRAAPAPAPARTEAIVRWDQIREGDLVLLNDALVEAVRVSVLRKPWGDGRTFTAVDISYRLGNGALVTSERNGDGMTAARRTAEL